MLFRTHTEVTEVMMMMVVMTITQWYWERLEALVKESPRSPIIKTPQNPEIKRYINPLSGTITHNNFHTHTHTSSK